MGRRHLIQCSVGQGSEEDRHKMILPVVSSLLLASLAFGAPGANYGAAAHVSPAKQISSPSIQCRTEYVTLWDTEYQEREEQVCETVYEKQCETRTQRLCQPTTRQECTTNYVKECSTIYKNVCVQRFRPSTSPTLSLSAQLNTNRTASTSGGVMATTRCGLPSREPARTFPTTSAGTWRRPTPSRSPTRSATTSPSRSACPSRSRPASPCPTRSARLSL